MVHRRPARPPGGELEDRFFATVFLGSGLLFLAMLFASPAVAGGIIIAYTARPEGLLDSPLQLALPSHVTRRRFEYQMQGSFGRYSNFGHAKTRPDGIWRDGFEELNWVAPYDRLLPLG